MNKLIVAALCLIASNANALWVGRLDFKSNMTPVMIRELHDGQWLAGIAKTDLYHVDQQIAGKCDVTKCDEPVFRQRFHAGMFQAWNAEHGNPATGLVLGVDLPPGFSAAVASALPDWFKPGAYVGAAVSLDFFGGYRPQHSYDTHSWVYGVGAKLSIDFGVKELQKGL